VNTSEGSYQAENVVIATGVNRLPKSPNWAGLDTFTGEVVHSKYYKNTDPFIGKDTLVVGMGNTGAELALDLSENDIKTYISVRSPISVVPRDLNGRPVQVTSKQLAKLPFGLGDWLGSQIRKIYFGDLTKYGLKTSSLHPAQQLRETGKTPVVDIGTINAIKSGKIIVKPDVKSIIKNQVTFVDGTSEKIDQIIFATGYEAGIEEFLPCIKAKMDENGLPLGPIGEGELSGLYFVGYDNYKLGGIIGTINTDSATVVNHLKTMVESATNSKS
jgi:cation diffusion facilitator CzcD-associated flavoprotein CzcO